MLQHSWANLSDILLFIPARRIPQKVRRICFVLMKKNFTRDSNRIKLIQP